MFTEGELIWNFSSAYKCAGPPQIPGIDPEEFDIGGRIIVPPSTGYFLSEDRKKREKIIMRVTAPGSIFTHFVGIASYEAEEDTAHVPTWLMQKFELRLGDLIEVEIVNLFSGREIRFEPLNKELFLIIPTYEVAVAIVKETYLRRFDCVNTGQKVQFYYGGHVLEVIVRFIIPFSRHAVRITSSTCFKFYDEP